MYYSFWGLDGDDLKPTKQIYPILQYVTFLIFHSTHSIYDDTSFHIFPNRKMALFIYKSIFNTSALSLEHLVLHYSTNEL